MNVSYTRLCLGLLILAACTTSCSKQPLPPASETPNTPVAPAFSRIQTNSQFNWSNQRTVNLQVKPIAGMSSVSNTLQVQLAAGEAPVFAAALAMDKALLTSLRLPVAVNRVWVKYGSIEKWVTLQNNTIEFDYTTE